ncbi:MAG: hypothetical protein CM15mP4_2870 [Candidatus Neomarinimicrobiota bacterium]|nr:MAG: hypothetical protein CM15mP4_2870 [Candidatus Neomarinimicrobiota bacterium]
MFRFFNRKIDYIFYSDATLCKAHIKHLMDQAFPINTFKNGYRNCDLYLWFLNFKVDQDLDLYVF